MGLNLWLLAQQMTKKSWKITKMTKSMENYPDNKKAWKITQTTKKHGKFSLLSSVSMLSCHLGNFPCFFPMLIYHGFSLSISHAFLWAVYFPCFYVFCWILKKKNSFKNTNRVPNSLAPDQARQNVGPDLGPNCLQRLSADDTSRQNKGLNDKW